MIETLDPELELKLEELDKETRRIDFTYFKDTGKYYSCGSIDVDLDLIEDCIYPRDIGKRLRSLKMLPDLANGTWESIFMCYPSHLYPELILD